MNFYVYTNCIYTRQGISAIAESLYGSADTHKSIYIFDLMRNPHPLLLLNEIKKCMQLPSDIPQKIIALCDAETATFLMRYNILCITQRDSINQWIATLKKSRGDGQRPLSNISGLQQYYATRPLSKDDIFILEHICQGFTFSQVAELSGLNTKTVYSRFSKLKHNFNLNNKGISLAYTYIKEWRNGEFDNALSSRMQMH